MTRFSGHDAAGAEAGGNVAVDGEVASAMLGADWTRGRWDDRVGGHAQPGRRRLPRRGGWRRRLHTDGDMALDALCVGASGSRCGGVAGYGGGSLTLEPRAEDGTRARAIRTDLDLWMARGRVARRGALTAATTASLWR